MEGGTFTFHIDSGYRTIDGLFRGMRGKRPLAQELPESLQREEEQNHSDHQ